MKSAFLQDPTKKKKWPENLWNLRFVFNKIDTEKKNTKRSCFAILAYTFNYTLPIAWSSVCTRILYIVIGRWKRCCITSEACNLARLGELADFPSPMRTIFVVWTQPEIKFRNFTEYHECHVSKQTCIYE